MVVSAHAAAVAGRVETIDALLATAPTAAVEQAFAAVTPDTVAKILFTSGSTGLPKGVINTQRMLCSNQQAIAQLWPFLGERSPVTVDWLPWSHTFGGNHNFFMVLWSGGTLYIDEGKPRPGLFDATLTNLREISPTLYFNVPAGFAMLIPHLESEPALRERFFRDLDVIFYAAAALPPNLWDRLEALSIAARGERVALLSAWGSTETAPLATSVHFPIERAGVIGLPAPGTEIALVPVPGAEDRLVFDGRTAESFKLTSGTWVHVSELRLAVIGAGAPLIQDAVVTGHDREEIGLLVFPSLAACREVLGQAAGSLDELVTRPEVHAAVAARLRAYNQQNPGSSRCIARVLLMSEPPSIDANEITDKGYINQRAVLECRAALVGRLHGAGGPDVIML